VNTGSLAYTDKFALTREQSVFLAKKKWDENVYCGLKMENSNVTFPETQTILQGANIGYVALDDVQAIFNLRAAWKLLLADFDAPLTLDCLCRLNGLIARNAALAWGELRAARLEFPA
jgi:hypothetical protein